MALVSVPFFLAFSVLQVIFNEIRLAGVGEHPRLIQESR